MRRSVCFAIAMFILLLMSVPAWHSAHAQSDIWVSGYYAGWMQGPNNTGYLPAEKIDYDAMTHIMHFSLLPLADGSLDDESHGVTAVNAAAVVSRAHAAGKKVLITIGGWATDEVFRAATTEWTRPTFIKNIVELVRTRGYDGVDIDWEPISDDNVGQFATFITELRAALKQLNSAQLLAAALNWHPEVIAQVQGSLDQANIMTYDLAAPWPGWVTWHNSPIYNGGATFPGTSDTLPSINGRADGFVMSGVQKSKIGIGIDFYGYVWSGGTGTPTGGVTAPLQSWVDPPSLQASIAYSTIMQTYYKSENYRWDDKAKGAYLSIDNPGSAEDKFISIDDERTCAEKIAYARSKGLGGVIIWELGGGYTPNASVPDPLLQAVKKALHSKTKAPPPPTLVASANGATNVSTSPVLRWKRCDGAASYRVQISPVGNMSTVIIDQSNITDTMFSPARLANSTKYYWRVTAMNTAGASNWSNLWSFTTVGGTTSGVGGDNTGGGGNTGSGDGNAGIPTDVRLDQNYPNPFNPSTVIKYAVPYAATVSLTVFNMLGQEVSTLVNGEQQAGFHEATFRNDDLPSGVYLYRLTVQPVEAGGGAPTVQTMKMQLMK